MTRERRLFTVGVRYRSLTNYVVEATSKADAARQVKEHNYIDQREVADEGDVVLWVEEGDLLVASNAVKARAMKARQS